MDTSHLWNPQIVKRKTMWGLMPAKENQTKINV